MKLLTLTCLIFLCCFLSSFAHDLVIIPKFQSKTDSIIFTPLLKSAGLTSTVKSDELLVKSINKLNINLWQLGYFESNINISKLNSDTIHLLINSGEQYKIGEIKNGNIPDQIWKEVRINKHKGQTRILNENNLIKTTESLIAVYENNGFPFISMQFDSIRIAQHTFNANIIADPGVLFRIDSILVKGKAKISVNYIRSKIGIHQGDLYNESAINKIDIRIKEIPFLQQTRTYDVFFTEENASITLYLDNKKASQFDGIIGLLSDNETGKIRFTGEFKMKLINSFGYGEKMDFNWKSPGNLSQNLFVGFNYPFIAGSPVGIDASFKLYKKDTTYLDLERSLGIRYRAMQHLDLKLFGTYATSDLLSTKQYAFSQSLPDFADVSRTNYGTGFEYINLDYIYNPRSGIQGNLEFSAGNRKIVKNSVFPEAVYDNIDLQSAQYKSWGNLDLYFPLKNRSTFKVGIAGGGLVGDRFFINELIKAGGLHSLRGFDEESILASAMTFGLLEYRYLLEENAYFALFTNAAWYEKNIPSSYIKDTPWGFGTGLSLETGLGIFSISYALGSEFGNPINFKAGKIHFGLLNSF